MKHFPIANNPSFARRAMGALLQQSTLLALTLALALSVSGCGSTATNTSSATNSLTAQERVEALLSREDETDAGTDSASSTAQSTATNGNIETANNTSSGSGTSDSTATLTIFTAEDIPAYTGELSTSSTTTSPFSPKTS